MEITVHAGNWAQRYLDGKARTLHTAGTITAFDAAVLAGIPAEEVGVITIGGIAVDPVQLLQDSDEIFVYPIIIGG